MLTPWGESEELRHARLPSGPRRGDSRTASNHRRRLLGAMVAAVAKKGYAEATTDEVAAIAGVSRNALYQLFGSKEACFFEAVDAVYRRGMELVTADYDREEDWEARLQAGFAALAELIATEQAASHACVIDIYETGEAGALRAAEGRAGFERLMRRALARCPRRAALPADMISAIVAAIEMLIHDLLRQEKADELPGKAEEVVRWFLSYESAGTSLHGPGRRVRPAQPEQIDDPRWRLLVAATEAVAETGYQAVTVDELARRASTSLRVLYEAYGGKEKCFLDAFKAVRDEALRVSKAAYRTEREWPLQMRAVNRALFAHLAARPAAARMALVEVAGAGRAAVDLRDEVLSPFADLVAPGRSLAPGSPEVAPKLVAFAVYAAAGRQVQRYGAASLPRLEPMATYLELAPFLGSAAALEVALPERRDATSPLAHGAAP